MHVIGFRGATVSPPPSNNYMQQLGDSGTKFLSNL